MKKNELTIYDKELQSVDSSKAERLKKGENVNLQSFVGIFKEVENLKND